MDTYAVLVDEDVISRAKCATVSIPKSYPAIRSETLLGVCNSNLRSVTSSLVLPTFFVSPNFGFAGLSLFNLRRSLLLFHVHYTLLIVKVVYSGLGGPAMCRRDESARSIHKWLLSCSPEK